MKSPKVLMVGLDAADATLLTRWVESGQMPNLRSIRDRGVWGDLSTPEGLGDDAVWASISTGSNPGSHGRFFHRQPVAGTYEVRRFEESNLSVEPFWNHLSRQGCSVAVIDVPKNPLSTTLNGIQLADWRVHGRDGDTRSFPVELASEILSRFGDDETDQDPNYLCHKERLSAEMLTIFVDRLLTSIEQKTAATEMLLGSDDWDLFLVVFKESHCVGHHCWHLMDAAHPEHDPQLAQRLGQPIERIYGALDNALGTLLNRVAEETSIVVFSGLGMSANSTGDGLLDSVLMRLEPSTLLSGWQRLHEVAIRTGGPLMRRYVQGAHKRLKPYRTAFPVDHNELSGAVRLNLKGREPNGRVSPEAADSVLEKLRNEFLSLRDADTGLPLVTEVIRSDSSFEGRNAGAHADLFVVWNRAAGFRRASSPTLGEIRAEIPVIRTGNHVAGGIYFACGPGVARDSQRGRANVVDLAPTVAAMLGHALPVADGAPIASLVE